jgi:hypothetical protein
MALWTKSYQVADSIVSWVAILVVNMSPAFDAGWFPTFTMPTFLIATTPVLASLYQVALCFG